MNIKIAVFISPLLTGSGYVLGADTGQLPCRTTAECNQQAAKSGATYFGIPASGDRSTRTARVEDQFFWLNKINKASSVMLTEERIISPDMGQMIAKAVNRLAFSRLKLHRLEANIQPANAASIALVRSCGFAREGYSPRYLKIGGRWRDHERWAIRAS